MVSKIQKPKGAKKEENPVDHVEVTKVSKIKLDDKGSKRFAVFLNKEKLPHIKRKMDGGVVTNALSADWMLSKPKVGDVIVELKGGDVSHALVQVSATAEFAVNAGITNGKIAALVLCTEHPGVNTKIQIAMAKFATRFKGPIHVRNRDGEFEFEKVLSFNGPEKL